MELYRKCCPDVPDDFQDDTIYAASSTQQKDSSKAAKQARSEHRAAMATAAKENSYRRGRDASEGTTAAKKRD